MTRSLQKMTISELIQASQLGQREAFDLLYEHFYDAVFRFVYNRMQNWQESEDLTQEIFIRIWLNIYKFKDQGIPFTHYLFRIAHNVIIDYHRRNKRIIYVEDVDFNRLDSDTEDMMRLRVDMQNLAVFLEKLPKDYQKVLVLRFLTGYTPRETAKLMDRTEVATRILQHRALHAVRELVQKEQNRDN